MLKWIKDKWELVVSGLVVLVVFVLGKKKQLATEKVVEIMTETQEKQIEVIEKTAAEERRDKALARKKFSETRLKLVKQRAAAISDLEKETIERKLQLIELSKDDPTSIDRIMMEEFNVAKLSRNTK